MKIYLDDERQTPDGWIRTYTPEETIELLKKGGVTHLSLDHDLGFDVVGANLSTFYMNIEVTVFGNSKIKKIPRNGNAVMEFLKNEICYKNNVDFPLPVITFHSANGIGVINMRNNLDAINRRLKQNAKTSF